MLGLLLAAAPVNLAVTAVALAHTALVRTGRATAEQPRTVLLSGGKMTKSLALARSFHRAGHRVVLVESHRYRLTGHRFSRAVDAFHVVPSPDHPDYAAALLRVVVQEGVDVYVPVCSPVASRYDAEAKGLLAAHCTVLHLDPEQVRLLDDKQEFAELAQSLGLPVPESYRVTSPEQVSRPELAGREGEFILKSIPYDPVGRLDLTRVPGPTPAESASYVGTLPISAEHPYVLQAFIEGTEYCTHSTVRDGVVQLHACCESSSSQLNYAMVDKPAIDAWVRHFVGALNLTGQVSFDFIETADGRVLAIECNPRTHSAITMFYDHPDVAAAYLDGVPEALRPLPSSRPTYWLYQELWRLLSRPADALSPVRTVLRGKDAIFAWSDPLPFFVLHHVQLPWLLLDNLLHLRGWTRIDVNIGKLVEPAGD